MDRTLIGPWKAEEKELSELLFQKLQGLALMHPPSEEFRRCLSDEMFLKSNQPAFFQVTHFLFTLLDPVEFKKRFYWPITDKRSESSFRSSTVDYLKHLNEKHQLQWDVKSYLVVMPGGMKFITFMLDLVSFVIRDLTRQRLKQLQIDVADLDQMSDFNLQRMRLQNQYLKDFASEYIRQVDEQIVEYHDKSKELLKLFARMSVQTKIPTAVLLREPFHKQFDASNRRLFAEKFVPRLTLIRSLEEPLVELRNAIKIFKDREAELKYDHDAVRLALRRIGGQHPQLSEFLMTPNCNEVGALIVAFNCIYSDIKDAMVSVEPLPSSKKLTVLKMASLKDDFRKLHEQIVHFKKSLHEKQRSSSSEADHQNTLACTSVAVVSEAERQRNLMMKLIRTPPIKMEIITANKRLFEDQQKKPPVFNSSTGSSFLNIVSIRRTVAKPKHVDVTLDPNNTLNKSKAFHPLQLLCTIKKSAKAKLSPQQNLSASGSKWKERQTIFSCDIETMPSPDGSHLLQHQQLETSDTILRQSPFSTPYSHKERTRIARSELVETNTTISSDNVVALLYGKKLSAVKKVQGASLNNHNLSTSPSGRFGTLATVDVRDIPKLQLDDVTINCSTTTTNDPLKLHQTREASKCEDENNINRANTQRNYALNFNAFCEEEALFNTSDSVLKDITM